MRGATVRMRGHANKTSNFGLNNHTLGGTESAAIGNVKIVAFLRLPCCINPCLMTKSPLSSAHQRRRLTIHIVAAMLIGAVTGIAINIFGNLTGHGNAHGWIMMIGPDGILQVMGRGFIALLQVLVVPLVFVSLVCGTAALDDVRRLGRIGLKTVALYLVTTAIAISLALVSAVIVRPGSGFGLTAEEGTDSVTAPPLVEVMINIFPRNVIDAMAEGNMLQIIVFSILLGISLSLGGEAGKRILSFFQDANEVIMKLVWIIMQIAPYGVFALLSRTFAELGFDAMLPLLKYFLLVLGVLILHAMVTYPAMLTLLARINPRPFLRKMREVQIFAFSTASSNATLPITLQVVKSKLGVKNSVASFTVPLGATINMDGTAIMQGVATVFIAQAYGLGLGITDYLVVILTATLASIGTAGVPGVGMILLGMVLTQVGLPVEGIALIIGIDRLLDMVRTAVNVTGDAMVSTVVAKGEDALDMAVFEESEAGAN